MKCSAFLLATASSLALASDDRDLSGSVWAEPKAQSHSKRQSTWDPPSTLVKPLQEVWDHQVETYNYGDLYGYENYGYDIVNAAQGNLKFCVRWDSTAPVTAAQRPSIEYSLQSNVKKWTDELTGFMGWPFDNVTSSVVGWATLDPQLLEGSTDGIDVYTTKDSQGVAECDPGCGRYFHHDNDYSACPGGADRHYDMSLWLREGLEGGSGTDWGQQVGSEYFLETLDHPHIWLHEFGHTLALDDFYDWTPTGMTEFIMNAGSSMAITEFDVWMMKDWWRHLAYRYVPAATVANSSSGLSTSDSSLDPSTFTERSTHLSSSTFYTGSSTSTASDADFTPVTSAEPTTLRTTSRPLSSSAAENDC